MVCIVQFFFNFFLLMHVLPTQEEFCCFWRFFFYILFVSYFIVGLELQLKYFSLVEIHRTLFTDLYKLLLKYDYPSKGNNLGLSLFILIFIFNH